MRIAALYDIHANLPALDAVLDDVARSGADLILIGGDVIPGPMPRETLQRLRGLTTPVACISGNGEREVLAVMAGGEPLTVPEAFRGLIRWTAGQLDAQDREWLASWPLTRRVPALAGDVLFCHATPKNDVDIFTSDTPDERVAELIGSVDAPLLVCGHTHMQFDRTLGRTRIVNAGSVGMPFDEPGAYWLLLGSAIELRRTSYDLDAAAAEIRATSYPHAREFADANVLAPPSAAVMRGLFTKASLGQAG
jgi:putative phosphoesterase